MTRLVLKALLGVALVPLAAQAVLVPVTTELPTGSRSTPAGSGIVASGGWSDAEGGFRIDWNITFSAGQWTYVYTMKNANNTTPTTPDTSHFIIEVSSTFTSANILAGTTGGHELKTYTGTGGSAATPCIGAGPGDNGGNPCLPGAGIYGIKWEIPDGQIPSATLVTDRVPIWGDFYAKDGRAGGIVPTAWNTGFGTDPASAAGPFTNWIPTPDTLTTTQPVPEPASLLLFGTIGLCAAYAFRKKVNGGDQAA